MTTKATPVAKEPRHLTPCPRRAPLRGVSLGMLASLGVLGVLPGLPTPLLRRAHAEATGRIGGFVLMDSPGGQGRGEGLAGVTLTVTSKSLIGGSQSAVTADDGSYIFQNLPPGEYTVTIATEGFAKVEQRGVSVNVGQQAAVDIRLQVETTPSEKAVIIERRSPALNPESAVAVTTFDNKALTRSPNFRQEKGVAQLAPGVTSGTDRVSVRGGLSRFTRYLVDGMDVSDVVSGGLGSSALINFDAVEQYVVATGAMDAEYNSLGLTQNMVTRSGGNKFTVDTSVILQPSFLTIRTRYPGRAPLQNGALLYDDRPLPDRVFYSGNLNVGGPIIKDRLWFFTSFQFNYNRVTNNLPALPFYPGRDKDYDRPVDQTLYLGRVKLTWQATAATRISLSFNMDRNYIGNAIASSAIGGDQNLYAPEAERQVARGGEVVILNWDTALSPKALLQIQAGFTTKRLLEDALLSGPDGQPDRLTPSHTLVTSDQYNGLTYINGNRDWLLDNRLNVQFSPALLYTFQALGTHNFKAGAQLAYMRYGRTTGAPGGYRYNDKVAGLPCIPGNPLTYSSCLQREEFEGSQPKSDGSAGDGYSTSASALNVGVFVQDRWTIARYLTVVPGMRIDAGLLWDGQNNQLTRMIGYGPRLSLIYDLLHDRTTLVRAHYGRHNDVGNAFVADKGNPQVVSRLYSWNPVTSAFDTKLRESGGAGNQLFDPAATPPKLDEASVGLQREVLPQLVVGADYTFRRYHNLWVNQEINQVWDPAGLRVIGSVDPSKPGQRVFYASTPEAAQRTYHGVDLWMSGSPGNFTLTASYTLGFTSGTVLDYFESGGYGYNPRLSPLFNGDTPDNYRHFLKGLVDYHFDFGLNVGLRFQYRSGQPQWQSFRSPADSSFTLYRTPRGTDTGISNGVAATNNPQLWSDFRLPDQFPLDLQVGYNLQKLTGQNIDLMMMIFNLLNIATPTAIDTRDGATYGQATRRLENLLAEFVIRYRY